MNGPLFFFFFEPPDIKMCLLKLTEVYIATNIYIITTLGSAGLEPDSGRVGSACVQKINR